MPVNDESRPPSCGRRRREHVEVVDALLEAGADFRTPLRSGFTPFFFAVREGRTDVVVPADSGRGRSQRNHAAKDVTIATSR